MGSMSMAQLRFMSLLEVWPVQEAMDRKKNATYIVDRNTFVSVGGIKIPADVVKFLKL